MTVIVSSNPHYNFLKASILYHLYRKAPKSLDFGAFLCYFGTFLTYLKISSKTFSNTPSNKALFFKVLKYFEIAQNMKNTQMQLPKELR